MKINLWNSLRESSLKLGRNNFKCLFEDQDVLALEKSPYFPLETNIKDNYSIQNITKNLCEQYSKIFH